MSKHDPNPAPGELRPCPFCGARPLCNHVPGTHCYEWYVECAQAFCVMTSLLVDRTVERATPAWNHRPAEDALRARVAELESALRAAADWLESRYFVDDAEQGAADEQVDALRATLAAGGAS